MSYPGYTPYQQGSGSNPYPQQQGGMPQPSQGSPYPPQGGVYPPSLGYGVAAPMYMPQPYDAGGANPYPQTTGPPSYPPGPGASSYPPGQGASPYPPSQGGYPPPQRGSGYPPPQGGSPYPPPHGGSGYPPPSSSAYPPTHGGSGYPPPASGGYAPNYPKLPEQHQHKQIGGQSYAPPQSQGHYTPLKRTPTVVPAHPFNPREDAEVLRKAMKGFGTDEKAIINVLTKRTNSQRLEIAVQFKTLYGKDLIKDLKSEISGNFENLVVAMMTPLPQFYAKELHDAISGLGTDEDTLIEVLCTLSNHEIRVIRQAYHQSFYRDLEGDLKGDTGGTFKRLMVSLCNAGRDESMVTNPAAAAADAQALLTAGELKLGTDESTFNMILCQRNHAQLQLIFQEYQRITGHDIEKAIKGEFSGDAEEGLLAVVRSVKSQPAFFAKRLHQSMSGMGTNDRQLIRLVVTRSEIDMGDIKREFQMKYNKSLGDTIRGDTSGDYKKCLLSLIGEQ